jgi:hypothetical protein
MTSSYGASGTVQLLQQSFVHDIKELQTSTRSVINAPCNLCRLTSALLLLIARYLPWKERLLQLTHLCRGFPQLTPDCFSEDHIMLSPRLLTAFRGDGRLRSLLSHITSLSFLLSEIASSADVAFVGSSSDAPHETFSRVQTMVIIIDSPALDYDHTHEYKLTHSSECVLDYVFGSLASFQRLTSLAIIKVRGNFACIEGTKDMLWRRLRTAKALQYLYLESLDLTYSGLAILASLPLTTLNLDHCRMAADNAEEHCTLSPTLRTLRLPFEYGDHDDQFKEPLWWIRPASDQCGLQVLSVDSENIYYQRPFFSLEERIGSISSITELDYSLICSVDALADLWKDDGNHLTPVLPALSSIRLAMYSHLYNTKLVESVEDEVNMMARYTSLIQCYNQQLTSIRLAVSSRVVFSRIIELVFSCAELRVLHLRCYEHYYGLLPTSNLSIVPVLSYLHTLALRSVVPLFSQQLSMILTHCPVIENLSLDVDQESLLTTLAVVDSLCPWLQSIDLSIAGNRVNMMMPLCPDVDVSFGRLVTFTVRYNLWRQNYSSSWASSVISSLVDVLKSAVQLKRFYLDLAFTNNDLRLLSCFPSLSSVMLSKGMLETHGQFFIARETRSPLSASFSRRDVKRLIYMSPPLGKNEYKWKRYNDEQNPGDYAIGTFVEEHTSWKEQADGTVIKIVQSGRDAFFAALSDANSEL